MSEGPGEQQEIQEESEPVGKTFQERMIELYDSKRLYENAIGTWLKITYEISVAAVGVAVFTLLPAVPGVYFGILSTSYLAVITFWITVSTTIFGITWCFGKPALEDDAPTDGGNQD